MPEQPTEEQIKEFQEKLAKMSPEEREAFFRQQCIFCQIIDGKIESSKIYDDEEAMAILDINPANPGHSLLMPKKHLQVGPQVPKETMERLGKITKHISNCCLQELKCSGTNIFIANGLAAGQRAQHFMLHVVPRKEGDNLKCFDIPEGTADDAQLDKLASDLKDFISKKLDIQFSEAVPDEPEQTEEPKEEAPEVPEPEPLPEPPTPEEVEPEEESEPAKKEKGYLYFVDKEGDISRVKMVKGRKKEKQEKEKVKVVGIKRKPNLLYYVDSNLEIKSAPMNRSGKKSKKKKSKSKQTKNKKEEPKEEVKQAEVVEEKASLDDIASLFK